MKIALIGANYTATSVGGFVTLTDELVNRLNNKNDICFIVYGETKEDKTIRFDNKGTKVVLIPRKGKIGLLLNRIGEINDAVYNEKADVIYLLGYVASLFISYKILKERGIKLVLNPDGLEWMRRKYNFFVKKFLRVSESVGLRKADFIITDSQEIGSYIKNVYGRETTFIPYGCGFNIGYNFDDLSLCKFGVEKEKYYMVVARCVPENYLIEIVKGFSAFSIAKKLLIVTNLSKDRYGNELIKLCEKDKRINLFGPIYDKRVLYYLRLNAFGYIHGHSVGGTNPSLVEAMGCGNIIAAHKNKFNLEVLGPELGYFFSNEGELKNILEMIEENKEVYIKRKLIKERAFRLYNWDLIVLLYLEFFNKLKEAHSNILDDDMENPLVREK